MYNSSSEILANARKLVEYGFSVFPLHGITPDGSCTCNRSNCPENDKGKHPKTQHGFRDATKDDDTLVRYFGNETNCNIGIATGSVSGINVVDIDKPCDFNRLVEQHGLTDTVSVKTGKGRHLYYKYANGNYRNAQGVLGCFDVRTDGGYVVAPGSVHRTGTRYEWVNNPVTMPFAYIDSWLSDRIPRKVPTGTTFVIADDTVTDRIAKYAETIDPAIQGKSGRLQAFKVCCYVVKNFPSATDDEIINGLTDWNNRCVPPWDTKSINGNDSLRAKVNQARTKTAKPSTEPIDESITEPITEPITESITKPILDPSGFYGIIGEAVRLVEPITEADPTAIMVQLLTLAGSAIGNGAYIDAGRRQYPNMYVCIVGQSSRSRKGTSYHVAKELFSLTIDQPKTLSGLGSGEALVYCIRDGEVQPKDDGVLGVVGGVDDKRVVVDATEFGSILKVIKRDGCTLSPIFRNAWDHEPIRSITKGRELVATNPHVSVIGHITIPELTNHFESSDDTTNGFANRILWVYVERSKKLPLPPSINSLPGINDIRIHLSQAIATARTIGLITFSETARETYKNEYGKLTRERKGVMDSITSRAEAHVIRLAMIYAALDGSTVIENRHLIPALALWDYSDQSAQYIFDSDDKETKIIREVGDKVRANPGLTKSKYRPNGHILANEYDRILSLLVSRGEAHEINTRFYPGQNPMTVTEPLPLDATLEQLESIFCVAEETATIAEVIDYRNGNDVTFVRVDGEVYLVAPDLVPIPDPITVCVRENQDIFSMFVPCEVPADPSTGAYGSPLPVAPRVTDIGNNVTFVRVDGGVVIGSVSVPCSIPADRAYTEEEWTTVKDFIFL